MKTKNILFILILSLSFFVFPASATTITVTEEDDLSGVVDAAEEGDILELQGEEWIDDITFQNHSITLKAKTGYTPTITSSDYSGLIVDINFRDNITLEGITVSGGSGSLDNPGCNFYALDCDFGNTSDQTLGISGSSYASSRSNAALHNVTFYNCSIHDTAQTGSDVPNLINIAGGKSHDGYNQPAAYDIVFDHCHIYGTSYHQYFNIMTRGPGSNVEGSYNKHVGLTGLVITDCLIEGIVGGNAVYTIYGAAESMTFANNTVDDTVSYAIKGSYHNCTFENNTYDNIGSSYVYYLEELDNPSWGVYNSTGCRMINESTLEDKSAVRTEIGSNITFSGCNYPSYEPRYCPDFIVEDNTVDFNINSLGYASKVQYTAGRVFTPTPTYKTTGSEYTQSSPGSTDVDITDIGALPDTSTISVTGTTSNSTHKSITVSYTGSSNPTTFGIFGTNPILRWDVYVNGDRVQTYENTTYDYTGPYTDSKTVLFELNTTGIEGQQGHWYKNTRTNLDNQGTQTFYNYNPLNDDVSSSFYANVTGTTYAGAWVTKGTDDFNRDNNASIGDAWAEKVNTGASITSNELKLSNTAGAEVIYLTALGNNRECEFDLDTDGANDHNIDIYFESDNTGLTGDYVRVTPGNYYLRLNAATTLSTDDQGYGSGSGTELISNTGTIRLRVEDNLLHCWGDETYRGYWSGSFQSGDHFGIETVSPTDYFTIDNWEVQEYRETEYANGDILIEDYETRSLKVTCSNFTNVTNLNMSWNDTEKNDTWTLYDAGLSILETGTFTADDEPVWMNSSSSEETFYLVMTSPTGPSPVTNITSVWNDNSALELFESVGGMLIAGSVVVIIGIAIAGFMGHKIDVPTELIQAGIAILVMIIIFELIPAIASQMGDV